jgi:DNA-binding response OmpR family regulator
MYHSEQAHAVPVAEFTMKVLIAEDEDLVAGLLIAVLTKKGFTTRLVEAGEDACQALQEEGNFDLLVSDLGLKGQMNGFGLIAEAKKLQPKVRSICISGSVNDNVQANALMAGFDLFIPKPFKLPQMDAALKVLFNI